MVPVRSTAPDAREIFSREFSAQHPGEGIAVIRASCARCDWGVEGREAAALRILLDGRYSQHLLLARGDTPSDYRVTLGEVAAGRHQITVEIDPELSASGAGEATVATINTTIYFHGSDARLAQSMAPILYARPNTVGRFTDLPILMWYEVAPTPNGRQFRYSVIFTNEDGGTATDRLMATWGRTTDIEFVYGVEVDPGGRVLAEEYQGPGHDVLPFRGRHEGRHPLLWVATDNNMVTDSGLTTVRYAPAPELVDLANASREIVMDANPWSYELTNREMRREGKIVEDLAATPGRIVDPRRFVFVEACSELEQAALSFAVHVPDANGPGAWHESDRGRPEFRIVRTGCFRGAVPLPPGSPMPDAIRFRAFSKPPPAGSSVAQDFSPAKAVITRANTMFMLDEHDRPRPSVASWIGSAALVVDGPPAQVPLNR